MDRERAGAGRARPARHVRACRGGARRIADRRGGRDRLADRSQRRRQEQHAERHRRPGPPQGWVRPSRGPRARRGALARGGGGRDRAGARGPRRPAAHVRRGEPPHRFGGEALARRPRGGAGRHRRADQALPFVAAPARRAGRCALRGRAADAGPRARPAGTAQDPPARRAVDGSRAPAGAADLRHRPRHPPRGHHHPPGGAECAHGAADGAAGVRAGARRGRAAGAGRAARERPTAAGRLPGRRRRMSGLLIPTKVLHRWTVDLWRAAGSDEGEATRVADHLVAANLAGHDSHGVGMTPRYVKARFVTNPFTVGIPGPGGEPIVLDFATSAIAQGKVRVAYNKRDKVPPGCLIDAQGRPTDDPAVLFEPEEGPRGALVTFAGHKGYALAMVCELLGAALTGGPTTRPANLTMKHAIWNNMLAIVFDPARLGSGASFEAEARGLNDWVRSAPLTGAIDSILMPGDPERRSRKERAQAVPVDGGTLQQLDEAAGAIARARGGSPGPLSAAVP